MVSATRALVNVPSPLAGEGSAVLPNKYWWVRGRLTPHPIRFAEPRGGALSRKGRGHIDTRRNSRLRHHASRHFAEGSPRLIIAIGPSLLILRRKHGLAQTDSLNV